MPPSSMLSYLFPCRRQTETGVFILTGECPLGRPNRLNIDIGGAGGKSEGVLQLAPPPHRAVRTRSHTDCWTGVFFWRSGVPQTTTNLKYQWFGLRAYVCMKRIPSMEISPRQVVLLFLVDARFIQH